MTIGHIIKLSSGKLETDPAVEERLKTGYTNIGIILIRKSTEAFFSPLTRSSSPGVRKLDLWVKSFPLSVFCININKVSLKHSHTK